MIGRPTRVSSRPPPSTTRPGALAIVLVGYAEALGGAKAAATPGGGDIDPNQELVLGQLPGTEAYRYVGRHPEAVTCPGLLIWRVGGDLFFASIGHFEEGLAATA